jgi:hypothetical protein
MARTKHLTPQQQRFVEAYVTGKSAADAAAEAGYRAENRHLLRVNAARVLATPRVRAEIDKRLVVVAKRTGVTAERAVRELETLAMSCVDNYVVDADGRLGLRDGAPKSALKAVQRFKYRLIPRADGPPIVEVEIALWDKLGALKTLGRHLGVFLPQVKEPDGADKVLDLFHEMLKARNERMREDDVRVVNPIHEIEARAE